MAEKKPIKKKHVVCGDFGGKRRDGEPCGVLVRDGRCRHHTEDANARKQRLKTAVLRLFQKGTYSLAAVCAEKGIDPSTLWRWRQDDPRFDKAFEDAERKSDSIRSKLVEDSLFKSLLPTTGKCEKCGHPYSKPTEASTGKFAFFLTNRARKRWKHRYALEHTGPDDGPIQIVDIDPSQLTEEEIVYLKELAQRVKKVEQ